MAINQQVAEVLEEQINEEFYRHALSTFADYYEERGLKGFANWYEIQAKEEMDHGMAIRRYLLDNDYKPVMKAIDQPHVEFSSDLEPLRGGAGWHRGIRDEPDSPLLRGRPQRSRYPRHADA